MNQLTKALGQKHASIGGGDGVTIACTLTSSQPNVRLLAQSWNAEVKEVVVNTLGLLETFTIPVADHSWEDVENHLKGENYCKQDEAMWIADGQKKTIQVVGLRDKADKAQKKIRKAAANIEKRNMKIKKREVKQKAHELKLLELTHYSAEIKRKYPDLSMTINLKRGNVCFQGTAIDIKDAELTLEKRLKTIKTKNMKLHEIQTKLLGSEKMSHSITATLEEKRVAAVWEKKNAHILVHAFEKKERNAATKIVSEHICLETCDLSPECAAHLNTRPFRDLVKSKVNDGAGRLLIRCLPKESCVVIAGAAARTTKREIEQYMDDNTIYSEILQFSPSRQKLVFLHWQHKLQAMGTRLENLKVQISWGDQGQDIHVQGTSEGLQQVRKELEMLGDEIICHSEEVQDSNKIKFLYLHKCIKDKDRMLKASQCIMALEKESSPLKEVQSSRPVPPEPEEVVEERETEEEDNTEDSEDGDEWEDGCEEDSDKDDSAREADGSTSAPDEEESLLPQSNASRRSTKRRKGLRPLREMISVQETDITQIQVDAIVNAANVHLNHAGGLALAIVKKGGREIQVESDQILKTRGQSLQEGDVVASGPGRLPCKEIFHAVGPRYHGGGRGERQLLLLAVKNCLLLATEKGYRTIALPGISTGIFGCPVKEATKVIVEAVKSFLQTKRRCSLRKVILCDVDPVTVQHFHNAVAVVFPSPADLQAAISEDGTKRESESVPTDRDDTSHQKRQTRAKAVQHTLQVAEVGQNRPGRGAAHDEPEGHQERSDQLGLPASHRQQQHSPSPHGSRDTRPARAPYGAVPKGNVLQVPSETASSPASLVSIQRGEIAKQKADVIVNSTSTKLSLSDGAISSSILRQAGPALQAECSSRYPHGISHSQVARTGGCNLQCKEVFHLALPAHSPKALQNLFQVVTQCLTMANSSGYRSIAFPALGTGKLKYPTAEVAHTVADAVKQFHTFPPPLLTDIRLVAYDARTFQEFQSVQYQTDATAALPQPDVTQDQSGLHTTRPIEFPSVNTQVQVFDGHRDHRQFPEKANIKLDFSEGREVVECILLQIHVVIKEGQLHCEDVDVVVTLPNRRQTSGGIPKNSFHINLDLQKHGDSWERAVLFCLTEAEKKGSGSMAIELSGPGYDKFGAPRCAEALFKAMQQFRKTSTPPRVQEVRLVFSDSRDVLLFYQQLNVLGEKLNQLTPDAEGLATNSQPFVVSKHSTGLPKAVTMYIYSIAKENIMEFLSDLESLVREHFKEERFEDEQLKRINKIFVKKIEAVLKNKDVNISLDTKQGAITLRGFKDDVMEARLSIVNVLRDAQRQEEEENRGEVYAAFVQWGFLDNTQGKDQKVKAYPRAQNMMIEAAYQAKQKTVEFEDTKGVMYVIDFDRMLEFPKTKPDDTVLVLRQDKLRDTEENIGQLPTAWGHHVKDELCKLVPLKSTEMEFQTVEKNFKSTIGNNAFSVSEVTRIQNWTLYHQYQAKKIQMETQNADQPTTFHNEMTLWHGTSKDATDNINHHGFNRSYCGKHATVHGKGVYFAVHSEYSARDVYSPPDASGKRYMYQSKVLVGVPCSGNPNMRFLPARKDNIPYDSATDHKDRSNMFVIFHDTQAYPEYLVTFQ